MLLLRGLFICCASCNHVDPERYLCVDATLMTEFEDSSFDVVLDKVAQIKTHHLNLFAALNSINQEHCKNSNRLLRVRVPSTG